MAANGSRLAAIPRWGPVLILLAGSLSAIAAGQFASLVIAEGIGLTVTITFFTILLWWPLRKQSIFWKMILVVAFLHLLLIFFISWPSFEPHNKIVILIGFFDLLSVLVISDRIEKKTRMITKNAEGSGS